MKRKGQRERENILIANTLVCITPPKDIGSLDEFHCCYIYIY